MDERRRVEQVLACHRPPVREWLDTAYKVLHDLCVVEEEITADLVWPRLAFPPSPKDGRIFGKVFRVALHRKWIEKWKDDHGVWRAYDHTDRPQVRSLDDVVIRQKALIPAYRSLIVGEVQQASGPWMATSGERKASSSR